MQLCVCVFIVGKLKVCFVFVFVNGLTAYDGPGLHVLV